MCHSEAGFYGVIIFIVLFKLPNMMDYSYSYNTFYLSFCCLLSSYDSGKVSVNTYATLSPPLKITNEQIRYISIRVVADIW